MGFCEEWDSVTHPGKKPVVPPFERGSLPPGTRLGLAVSGGADSIALLRIAHRLAFTHGWTLQVLHLEHGLRGEDGRADAAFVAEVADKLELRCILAERDTRAAARERKLGLEETGRLLRYQWFGSLLATNLLDAVATGHTLDDQAETVLGRLLRGAWSAGLAGIYPSLSAQDLSAHAVVGAATPQSRGQILRPLLATRREALRIWLTEIGQSWREDASNADMQFTRNRIRHDLLPSLRTFNPRIDEQLAQTAVLARMEEQYWQTEVARLLPGLLLPGRPIRGGGRASSTLTGERSLAIEVERLRAFPLAVQRRLLRAVAAQFGVSLAYEETARLVNLLEGPVGSTPRRKQLAATLRAERTPRELRFVANAAGMGTGRNTSLEQATVAIPVPGIGTGLGVSIVISVVSEVPDSPEARLRAAAPSDRVRLRHSSGAPKRVKEVLERMGIPAPDRTGWPVLEWQGEIIWLKGAMLEPTAISSLLTIEAAPALGPIS
jgi:tRNA(Ile)-lysidine synthase